MAEADRQASQGDVSVGAGVAQAPGRLAEMAGHLRQEVRLMEVESLAQLQQKGAVSRGVGAAAETKASRRMSAEVLAGVARENSQASLLGRLLKIEGQSAVAIGAHNPWEIAGLIVAAARAVAEPAHWVRKRESLRSRCGCTGARGWLYDYPISPGWNERNFSYLQLYSGYFVWKFIGTREVNPFLCLPCDAPFWRRWHRSNCWFCSQHSPNLPMAM